jgi:hypothetical protein
VTSFQQFEANRRNALRSTGPKTDDGRRRSRVNAVRHGLTAETVIGSLEDAEDYKAFEATIIADYCPETAVARELVLRLASLLWRLRRATAIETDLFEIQAEALHERRLGVAPNRMPGSNTAVFPAAGYTLNHAERGCAPEFRDGSERGHLPDDNDDVAGNSTRTTRLLTYCFLRCANLDRGVFKRLNRYEAALWRQAVQTLFALHPVRQR